jgi:peptidoglycan hydrolase CwlO-like protein
MEVTFAQIIITVLASMLSGLFASLISYKKNKKAELARLEEKAQDNLKLELKDLQIKLYRLEKDLDEWKSKYYDALQELIQVKAELEDTLIRLTHAEVHIDLEG